MEKLLFSTLGLIFGALLTIFGAVLIMKSKEKKSDNIIEKAKMKWDENVYCGMRMENRAVTFPQTQTILNGVNVPNVQLDDIQAILNMRDAWKFLLSTINEEVTFEYWCKLNEYIARNEALEWGKLRTGSVGISGTDYAFKIVCRSGLCIGT